MEVMVQQRKKQCRIVNNILRYRPTILSTFMVRSNVCLMRDMLASMKDIGILDESTMCTLFQEKKLKHTAAKVFHFVKHYLISTDDWDKFNACVDILMQTIFTAIGYVTPKLAKIKSR